MMVRSLGKGLLFGMLATALGLSGAVAAEYVSVVKDGVNLRSAAGTNAEILFQLPLNYPLEVIGKDGQWLKVSDYEGDKGYIQESLVGKTPHVIVKAKECKIYNGPSTKEKVVGNGAKDVILQKVEQKGDWIKVTHPSLTGWVNKSAVWP
ncbi:SH3 domain-containing protein [Desulfobulbus sp.]|uniref:SH3 domain-containing protein n=1 Tax=Desulfobulbus sp. TaxID=895 RepID=UPI00286F2E9A|nr:SH3 domain-containing protein [Desulfobulbus sp.]